MRTKKDKMLYVVSIVISFLMFISIFASWLSYRDETYTLYEFYAAVKRCGGLETFARGDNYIYPAYVFLILPALAGILSGVKTVFLIFRRRNRILAYIIYGLEGVYMSSYFAFGGYLPLIPAIACPILAFADFMVNKYREEYEEINRRSRELKAKEKKEKEERKRRLYYPGKYSKYYYHMVVQNIKYYKLGYILLIANAAISVTFLFTILGIENILENVHTSEVLLLGNGMQGIMKEAVATVVVINALMMGFSFHCYVKNKAAQERIMILLGTRRKLLRKTRIIEYAGCLVIALILGVLFGNVLISLFKAIIPQYLEIEEIKGVDGRVYFVTVLIFSAITLISLLVNNEIYEREKYKRTIKIDKEKIPGNKICFVYLMLGSIVSFIAGSNYSQRRYAESIYYIYLFIFGAVCVVISLCAIWVKWTEKGKRHYKQIMTRIPFTCYFGRTSKMISIMLVIHFIVLSVYTIQFAGLMTVCPAEELYPYDFVCMAYSQDEAFFTELKANQIEVQRYPMVRVTSVEGDSFDWKDAASNKFMGVLWPQGQHIGISESTYMKLQKNLGIKTEKLNLKGEEIHIVYQQDSSFKAHPLDWYLDRKKPYLRIGQPLRFYDFMDREMLYPPRIVKSEEIQILTGMFERGMQENIVVFSDGYFETLEGEGPKEYYLLNVNEDDYQFVKERMELFEKKHLEDSSWAAEIRPYYDKKQMIKDTESERLLKIVVSVFEIVMLVISTILIISLKFVFEYDELKERYQLLFRIGMRKKERRQVLRKEIKIFFIIPIVIAAVLAAGVTVGMFKLRMYGKTQVLEYLKCAIYVWGGYMLIQIGVYQWIKRKLYRIIGENEIGGAEK